MAWEKVEKTGRGMTSRRTAQWYEVPCVSLGKTTLVFNEKFRDAFTNGEFRGVYILIDKDRRVLGFKIPTKEQIQTESGWYSVSNSHKGYKNAGKSFASKSFYTSSTKRFAKEFPDCVGHAYRAHLNPEERIIEVSLSPANVAK